jgi:amino acid adenylation domain-containing protein
MYIYLYYVVFSIMNKQSPFIHSLIEIAADLYPDKLAVVFENSSITYSELNKRADVLSAALMEIATQEEIIGISTTRSIDMVIGMLAILKAGKAYLPIDSSYPIERQKYVCQLSKVKFLLAIEEEQSHWIKLGLERIDFKEEYTYNSDYHNTISKVAAVLFTSGSTGEPKGVVMGHLGIYNQIKYQLKNGSLNASTKCIQFTHLGFDYSMVEIFGTLAAGGELHLIAEEDRLDSNYLLKYTIKQNITRLFLPFVVLQKFVEEANLTNIYPFSLKEIITGGELLKINPEFKGFFHNLPLLYLTNIYGPTEASVNVTEFQLRGDPEIWEEIPPIGNGIHGAVIWVLDKDLKIVEKGEIGELCISGDCLALGYINREDLTNEKFVNWKNPGGEIIRIYKTGDLVLQDNQGNYHFKGREDDQVKIRGNRIEIGEVELALTKTEGVRQAAVRLDTDATGQKFLSGYVILSDQGLSTKKIKETLRLSIPDYMIPEALMVIDQFPMTSTGKIDKKALPKPTNNRPVWASPIKLPETEVQQIIHAVFLEVLNYDKLCVSDNFFEFGGNSIKAQLVVSRLRHQYHYQIPITKFYQFPSVLALSGFLEKDEKPIPRQDFYWKSDSVQPEVAVIGINLNFPGARNTEEFLESLKQGKEAIRYFENSELDPSLPAHLTNHPNFVAARGVIEDFDKFDPAFFAINPQLASISDPQLRKFLEVCYGVLEQTGYVHGQSDNQIGVFAGCSANTYYSHNLISHMDYVSSFGDFQAASLTEKDFLATRTAFHLNLTGPAVNVYAACSTSLLTIAQAVDSIKQGKCIMALAGGVSIKSPAFSGHIYEEGSINSKDGHVNSFDSNAHGTVFSDGVGAVLLKRLDLAQADGDEIYAVIKGTGVNNDGGSKGSFTAPSAAGQADAIAKAIREAKVNPEDIGYLEAHATATPIGDPIEIEGLKMAFGATPNKQYCAIGTVKANIGHLNAASGIAGFIKAVLAVKHGLLFPQINYKNPNPAINFEDSPFFVNTTLKPWDQNGKRIAGVSSFGVGGTNVHVILEEAEKLLTEEIQTDEKPAYLINWSAKSDSSLQLYAKKLVEYVQRKQDVPLQAIAATLQLHRKDYPKKASVIVKNKEELINKLKENNSIAAKTNTDNSSQEFVYLFPGQGAQYVEMGKSLYDNFEVYRAAVDEGIRIANPLIEMDLKEILFPQVNNGSSYELLQQTRFTQPAIFITEYAMAKLWSDLGITPSILCGHSIGEFAAAVVASIMSFEDALTLICLRGKLMDNLPGGAMLAIRAELEIVKSILPEELAIAAINSPNSMVVSGEKGKIQDFAMQLQMQGISSRILQTSHAFHSPMMAPVRNEFESAISKMTLKRPVVPMVSTVTGKLLKDEEAMSPAYWVEQVVKPVLFSEAITTIREVGDFNFLEVGPGNVLSALVRQQIQKPNALVFQSIEKNQEGRQTEFEAFLYSISKIWEAGIPIRFQNSYLFHKILFDLPTYAFEKIRCWLDPVKIDMNKLPVEVHDTNPNLNKGIMNTEPVFSDKIKDIILQATGISMPDGETTFSNMGLDSLILTQLSAKFRNEFGVKISFRQLNEDLCNISQISKYLHEQIPAAEIGKWIPQQIHLKNHQISTPSPNVPLDFHSQVSNGNSEQLSMVSLIAQQMDLLSQQLKQIQMQGQSNGVEAYAALQPMGSEKNNSKSEVKLSEADKKEIQKPFGAIARIQKKDLELTGPQSSFVESHLQRYIAATPSSKNYTQSHRGHMADPRVVSGFKPKIKEMIYSLVINRSKGSKLWDIDGNEYIDVLNGFGAIMFGHRPDFINDKLKEQLDLRL